MSCSGSMPILYEESLWFPCLRISCPDIFGIFDVFIYCGRGLSIGLLEHLNMFECASWISFFLVCRGCYQHRALLKVSGSSSRCPYSFFSQAPGHSVKWSKKNFEFWIYSGRDSISQGREMRRGEGDQQTQQKKKKVGNAKTQKERKLGRKNNHGPKRWFCPDSFTCVRNDGNAKWTTHRTPGGKVTLSQPACWTSLLLHLLLRNTHYQ